VLSNFFYSRLVICRFDIPCGSLRVCGFQVTVTACHVMMILHITEDDSTVQMNGSPAQGKTQEEAKQFFCLVWAEAHADPKANFRLYG